MGPPHEGSIRRPIGPRANALPLSTGNTVRSAFSRLRSETLHSQVIASDNFAHYKETVITYLDLTLLSKAATLKALSIWSDGVRSQFKNKYTLVAIAVLENTHDVKIIWNFLATSHDKGPVDGIGAAKRHVWNMIKTRQNQVTNATSFTASETMPNVEVIEMTSEMINNTNKELGLDDVFKNAVTLRSIANVHCVTVNGNDINMS